MQACLCGPVCCSHFRQSEVAELHFCTCTRARAHTHTHTCFVVYAYAWVDVRIYAHFLMPVAYICPILTEHARMHVALLCLRACTWACAHRLREAKCQHTNWEGLSCADLAVSLLSNIFEHQHSITIDLHPHIRVCHMPHCMLTTSPRTC